MKTPDRTKKTPFKDAWWSFDLGTYRPADGTYVRYPYDTIPPLDESLFDGSFRWLSGKKTPTPSKGAAAHVASLEKLAKAEGLTLPPAFLRFMSHGSLQDAVPSCTACEWDLSDAPVPNAGDPGAYTIRFLRDQQDCLFWYLHIRGDESCVVCSPIPFDDPDLEASPEAIVHYTQVCAPHFEHFVYRFWLENEIWDQLSSSAPSLSEPQRAYLAHYEVAKKPVKKAVKKPVKKAVKKPVKKTASSKPARTVTKKLVAKKPSRGERAAPKKRLAPAGSRSGARVQPFRVHPRSGRATHVFAVASQLRACGVAW